MVIATNAISGPVSAEKIEEWEIELIEAKSRLEVLGGLENTEMIRKAAMLGIESPTIQRYYPKYNDLLLEEQQALESGLNQEDPQVKAIQPKLASLRAILMEAAKDVRGAMEIRVRVLERRLDKAKALMVEL